MRIGTMFLGRVEALDHESIQTKFFVLGVPLFPVASYFATAEHVNGVQGFEIPIHSTSVLAGYLRVGSALAALVSGIFAWVEHRSYDPQYGLFAVCAISLVVWGVSMFAFGRLSDGEKARRTRLRAITGVGAPPEIMPESVRMDVEERLARAWQRVGGGDWKERLRGGGAKPGELGLLYALAEYESDPELVAIARRQLGA
jgi:hypothetical protein